MNVALSRNESFGLITLSAACIGVLGNTFQGDGEPLIASLAFAGIGFAFAYSLIRWLGEVFVKAGLKGKDMSKKNRPEMYGSIHIFPSHSSLARCASVAAISSSVCDSRSDHVAYPFQ